MWYCNNKYCANHNVKIPIDEVILLSPYYTEKQRVDHTRCSKCNQPMCREEEDNNNTVFIGKFNSMSNEDKKNMLKKRAQEHYEKFDKETVERKKKQAICSIAKQTLK